MTGSIHAEYNLPGTSDSVIASRHPEEIAETILEQVNGSGEVMIKTRRKLTEVALQYKKVPDYRVNQIINHLQELNSDLEFYIPESRIKRIIKN